MAWQKLHVRITGEAPLIFHNGQLSAPMSEGAKAIKKVSGKRDKTDADHAEMARLEFYYGLYLQDGRVVLPGMNLEGCILVAARTKRLGKQVSAGCYVENDAALEYDGPQTPDGLWEDKRFVFSVGVRVQGSRVQRTRPRFDQWAAQFTVVYDDEMVSPDDMLSILKIAGSKAGLGDWRPKFGRFAVAVLDK